jgi:predicted nuclease with TOPRIM domain
MFRSIVGNIDTKANPMAIPDYLEKHFKEKEALKKQKQMMGGDEEELKNRIRKMDEETSQLKSKLIDTSEFKNKKEKIVMGEKEEKYM